MKQLFSLIAILTLLHPGFMSPTSFSDGIIAPENNSGAVLCPPAAYLQTPAECAPLGPSQYLTSIARQGMSFPLRPLPISHPEFALNELPYHYYRIDKNTGTGFYPSIEAARERKGATVILPPGSGAFYYVVYDQRLDTNKGTFFQLPSGAFMPGEGEDIRSITTPFPGIEVHNTPPTAFGFIFSATDVRREPNEMAYNTPIRQLQPEGKYYPIVQVFSTEIIEGTTWHLIGPDEWVVGRDIAVVTPNTTPPDGVTNGRWIDVNLEEQSLAVYENSQMVYATVVATGLDPLFTKPGLFPIYKKKELETMQGERGTPNYYYLENVPWTMYFDKARALHGAYWRARLGYPQSHGCVNLYPGDAHWLFNWANEGDWVYVHDPSGQTPTDPSYYGDGGA
jgi:lipoprotein-anchoring transpeptidase ErfK/SrfK